MRSPKSRSRAKGNRRPQGNIINRVFDSSGPEGKVRGTPQQIIEKYQSLARDATLSNDRVAAENFQQHAEHYVRLLAEAQKEMDARRERQEAQGGERRDRGDDQDDDNEGDQQPDRGGDAPQEARRPRRNSRPEGRTEARAEDRPDAQADSRNGGVVDPGGGESQLVETPETSASAASPVAQPGIANG